MMKWVLWEGGRARMAAKQRGKGCSSSAMGSGRTQPGQEAASWEMTVGFDWMSLHWKEFCVCICHLVMIENHLNELCMLMSYRRKWGLGVYLSNEHRLGFNCHTCGTTCGRKAMTPWFAAGILSSGLFYPQFHPSLPCHFHYSGDLVCLPDSAVSCTPH